MAKTAEVNSQRIVQAVRRIAATVLQEDSPLDAAKPKARIGKTRGAAYYNSNGDIDSGDEVPAEAVDPDKDDDSSTKERDYQPISDDHKEGDTVDEIEAFDCTTGQKIQLDLAPEEGIEFVPPDGWDGPDTPPPVDGYAEGFYWTALVLGSTANGSSFSGVATAALNIYQSYFPADSEFSIYSIEWPYNLSNTQALIRIRRFRDDTQQYQTSNVVAGGGYGCYGSTEDYCTISPALTEWPSDNITTLILKDGTFQAHDMDPDAADAYKNTPPSSIEVCDGQGNRYSVSALENGRSMITKLNPDGTVPESGHSLIIDRNGKVANKIGNKVRDGYL